MEELDFIKEIEELDKKRYELIAQEETPENNQKIEDLTEQILELIYMGKYELDFEFIMHHLTRLGQAPCLLYDDDGHWAITCEGYVSAISDGPDDWEGLFQVPKEKWYNTIREALFAYLEEE